MGVGGTGKKKIEIKKKEKSSQLMVTFSKRRKGLVKKMGELHSITAAKSALALFTPSGKPFTHGDPDFDSVIDQFFRSVGQCDGDDSNSSTTTASTSTSTSTSTSSSSCVGSETVAFRAKNWLEGVKVDEYDNLEDLLCLVNNLEGVQKKFDDLLFFHSLFDY